MKDKMVPWLLIIFLSVPRQTLADGNWAQKLYANPFDKGLAQIPSQPSQPPGLIQRQMPSYSHCERFFLFKGQKYECDSNLGRDAERLRPIVQGVPQALSELDIYQKNLHDVRISGFLVSSALVLVALGMIFSQGQPFNPSNGAITPGGGVMLTGLILGVGGIFHGFSLVNSNETHIEKAVNSYNAAHPEQPVELQFKTGVGSKLLQ